MSGSVEVTSELNKGSVFSMTFKVMCRAGGKCSEASLENVSLANQDLPNFKPKSKSGSGDDRPRLLLVNDDNFLLFSYFEQLSIDFEVEQAENGL